MDAELSHLDRGQYHSDRWQDTAEFLRQESAAWSHSYDSAFCLENGMVMGQLKTAEKSNEITAIPELLKTNAKTEKLNISFRMYYY